MYSIRATGETFGIAKIVPPAEWNPPCRVSMETDGTFPTKLQDIHTIQQGQGFEDGKVYNIQSYKDMADNFAGQWRQKHHAGAEVVGLEALEKDYWDIVETSQHEISVEYANDLDTAKYTSGFAAASTLEGFTGIESETCADMFSDEYYARSGWNLRNIPSCQNSMLKYLRAPINGINVPWLYIGMQFASFCWHTEDNYFYSINYSHFGEAKQWYGVPSHASKKFEKVSGNI